MVIVTIVAAIILIFSFIGGLTQGLVKSFFSLVTFIVAVPVAGLYYTFFAGLLGFIHNHDWENFLGFFITMAVVSIILSIVFYFPRKILEKTWQEDLWTRLVAGLLNLLGAGMGLVILTTLVTAFPIWEWLRLALADSSVTSWLLTHLTFAQSLLPEALRSALAPAV
jgi:uncharacterized membrane protein required for colicin V production